MLTHQCQTFNTHREPHPIPSSIVRPSSTIFVRLIDNKQVSFRPLFKGDGNRRQCIESEPF